MISKILEKLTSMQDLCVEEMSSIMDGIMLGSITPAQSAAFLTALRMKGECVNEVFAAASIMRQHAAFIDAGAEDVVDTCGTGGDGHHTFNISTTAAFVTAGAGVTVAKHGNRSVSSKCGSADVLAALGFNLEADPLTMEQSIQENGIGFLFAPKVHPAMKQIMGVRRELGIRTIFNMLGPLTNPAGATGQVLGVFAPELTEMFAGALNKLGTKRAYVVHGNDGLDEISCCASTRVSELRDGNIKTYELFPEMLLGSTYSPDDLGGGDAAENAQITRDILAGKRQDGARAIVLLNAAAAIAAGGKADTLEDGLKLAAESLDSGKAMEKLNALVEASKN